MAFFRRLVLSFFFIQCHSAFAERCQMQIHFNEVPPIPGLAIEQGMVLEIHFDADGPCQDDLKAQYMQYLPQHLYCETPNNEAISIYVGSPWKMANSSTDFEFTLLTKRRRALFNPLSKRSAAWKCAEFKRYCPQIFLN